LISRQFTDSANQVSTENGLIHCYDVRSPPATSSSQPSKALWSLQAHDESLSSFDINPLIPGFIATGSTDKTVKLWNIDAAAGPSMVISRDLDVGKVFSTTFAPDKEVGFRLAVAGSKGSVIVWDTATNAAVRHIFGDRVPKTDREEKVVGVDESDDESEEDQEEDENEGSQSASEEDSDDVMED
jgi:periodic tryptophan protein 1